MSDHLSVSSVEKDGEDGLIVTFSDGTKVGYLVEELIDLRPIRELAEKPLDQNPRA